MSNDTPIGWPEWNFPIQPFQPSLPLPNYDNTPYNPKTPYAIPPVFYPNAPIGCICPPGANKECERGDCPRKGISK